MDEPDLSGIDPLRIPEARRRIGALNEYLAMPAPTTADTIRLASSIGLSRPQFARLARVWRDHRDARLLVIGKRGASTRDYGVDPRALAIASEVIDAAGAGATLARTAPEIERRCALEGVKPLARSTINNHLRAARAVAQAEMDGPPRIAVGRMWFHLPVAGMPANAMPVLLAAVALPERAITAHVISTDPERPPSVSEVVGELAERCADLAARTILLDADDRRVATEALEAAGIGKTRSHNRSVQREISKAFAGRLGPLAAVHQRGMARPATKRVITRQDQPLSAAEVAMTIHRAVDAHNAAVLEARAAALADHAISLHHPKRAQALSSSA